MQTLNVIGLQQDLVWDNPQANREKIALQCSDLPNDTDLVVLPEMFTTGFSLNVTLAETMTGTTVQWMQKQAEKGNFTIIGSILIQENNNYYNRLLVVNQNGVVTYYNKRHLFTLSTEHNVLTPGTEQVLFNLKGWNIALQVCYDLRFPVWSRYTNSYAYDALVYVANWPDARLHAWNTLLQARSIENQAYVIAVNRVGNDGNNYPHSGASVVLDPLGKTLSSLPMNTAGNIKATLNKADLETIRAQFPFNQSADAFTIKH